MLISLVKLVKKIILGFDKSLQTLMQINIIMSTVKGLKLYFLINESIAFYDSYESITFLGENIPPYSLA